METKMLNCRGQMRFFRFNSGSFQKNKKQYMQHHQKGCENKKMSRNETVSRTRCITECKCLCVFVESEKTAIEYFTLPKTYKNDADVLKAIRKNFETSDMKIVHLLAAEVKRRTYSMSIEDFINLAKELED